MHRKTRVLLVSGTTVVGGVAVHLCGGERSPDCTRTILGSVEHRLSSMQTLRGRVFLRYVSSQRQATVSWSIYAASAASRRQGAAPTIPRLGRNHASVLDFSVDFANHRWRTEVVDLVNTGSDWTGVGGRAAEKRDMDPRHFYRIRLSDGEKVYEYYRADNIGFVRDRERGREPDEIELIRWRIVATIEPKVMRAVEEQGFAAILVGEETVHDNRCVKVRVHGPAGSDRMVANLWIAPDLGHATVRQEILGLSKDNKPWSLRVVTASDFVELAPEVWCPKTVKVDNFYYSERPHEEPGRYTGSKAWWYTEMLRWGRTEVVGGALTMEANGPVDITAPFPFPFDARVQYDSAAHIGERVRNSPSWLLTTKLDELLPEVEPDPLGSQLTTETAVTLFGGGE